MLEREGGRKMTAKLHWDKDDPATPALIEPLFEDMTLGEDNTAMPESLSKRKKQGKLPKTTW
jgi:hypothetical protein